MDRELAITVLNINVTHFNAKALSVFIDEYLKEKGIEKKRIDEFTEMIMTNPIFLLENTFSKCLNHCISYYLNKFSINSILENNRAIYYY